MFKKSIKKSKALFAEICSANKQMAKNREQEAKRPLPRQFQQSNKAMSKGGSKQ